MVKPFKDVGGSTPMGVSAHELGSVPGLPIRYSTAILIQVDLSGSNLLNATDGHGLSTTNNPVSGESNRFG